MIALFVDVENAYAGLEKKGKGKKGKGAAKAADSSQPEDKKLMHSLDMLGAFATLKVTLQQHKLLVFGQTSCWHLSAGVTQLR